MPTLLLIDGSSFLYRAFYALPDLRSPSGQPTGAVYGIGEMLKRLRKSFPTAHGACVFDAPGKTFRDDIYPEYKSHRPPMPEDLRAQIAPIHDLVKASGWPLLEIAGVEADDVIATLAQRFLAADPSHHCIIATGDKDLAQLVNPRTKLVNTMTNEVLDEAAVRDKFGVAPERILDYLCLVGDSVDGIPGVDKVGPKTAAKWIEQYGSLEGVISHAADIKGVIGDNLRRHLPFFPVARDLITVRVDLPLDTVHDNDLSLTNPDPLALKPLAQSWGFKSWMKELDNATTADTTNPSNAAATSPANAPAASRYGTTTFTELKPSDKSRYQMVVTEEALATLRTQLHARSGDVVAFDTETTALDPFGARLVGMSFCLTPGEAYYLPLGHHLGTTQLPLDTVLAALGPWLSSPTAAKVGQNIRFDAHILANHGITLAGIAHDTQLQSYVLASDARHDLDSLAKQHLGIDPVTYESLCGKGAKAISFADVDLESATLYAAEDADLTLTLHQQLWPQVQAEAGLKWIYETIEMPLSTVLWQMERNGVLIDSAVLQEQSQRLGKGIAALETEINQLAGSPLNINSPKQLAEVLFDRLRLPISKKTPGGAPSTDEEVLQKLALDYPIAQKILDYRTLSKLKSTYTDKLPHDVRPQTGRVHSHYGQSVAVTGRLNSNNPNLQNIPIRTPEGRLIRTAFIAPPGSYIVSADYSQIELRLMAHLSQDETLIKAFHQGLDIHQATAAEIFQIPLAEVSSEQRRYAKTINFGLIYGMSAFGLASTLQIERSAAQHYIDQYFQRYPGIARYMSDTKILARQQGYVETILGRRLWVRDINSSHQGRRQASERAAINAPMQGSAADYIKLAMISLQQWLSQNQLKSLLVMQVHDELVLEVPEAEISLVRENLPKLMAAVANLSVPLTAEVGVGANWDQAH